MFLHFVEYSFPSSEGKLTPYGTLANAQQTFSATQLFYISRDAFDVSGTKNKDAQFQSGSFTKVSCFEYLQRFLGSLSCGNYVVAGFPSHGGRPEYGVGLTVQEFIGIRSG